MRWVVPHKRFAQVKVTCAGADSAGAELRLRRINPTLSRFDREDRTRRNCSATVVKGGRRRKLSVLGAGNRLRTCPTRGRALAVDLRSLGAVHSMRQLSRNEVRVEQRLIKNQSLARAEA